MGMSFARVPGPNCQPTALTWPGVRLHSVLVQARACVCCSCWGPRRCLLQASADRKMTLLRMLLPRNTEPDPDGSLFLIYSLTAAALVLLAGLMSGAQCVTADLDVLLHMT